MAAKRPGIKPNAPRFRPSARELIAPTLYQRFQAWVRSLGARLMHFGRRAS